MDLIILGLIAVFILYRLYVTLGEKTGFDPTHSFSKKKTREGIIPNHKKTQESKVTIVEIPSHLRDPIQQLTRLDPAFSLKSFIEGATTAFEMIIEAYAKGNLSRLQKLLSPDLYATFKKDIEDHKRKGHVIDNTLVRVEEVVVEEAKIEKTKATLRVKYVTEQIPLVRNKKGEIVEGNPNQIDQVIDYWTFQRSIKSSDPNWILISTEN